MLNKKKLADQAKQMELDDKLQREQLLLKKLEDADAEDQKENLSNKNYFERTKLAQQKETAFEDMKNENLSDVSSMIIKKAKKSFLQGFMPDF